jgi:hypothetical protein
MAAASPNKYHYVNNNSITFFDPSGMDKVTVTPVVRCKAKGDCGGAILTVSFALHPNDAMKSGVLVQEVTRNANPVLNCDGTPAADLGFFKPAFNHYYEAWNVTKGEITPVADDGKTHDIFLTCPQANRCGVFTLFGSVAFFEKGKLDETWQPGMSVEAAAAVDPCDPDPPPGVHPAGVLPHKDFTGGRPPINGWDNAPKTKHTLRVEWSCCACGNVPGECQGLKNTRRCTVDNKPVT